MNDKDQENGALRGPLIFTVPATVLSWPFTSIGLAGPTGQLFPPSFAQEVEPVEPGRFKPTEQRS